MITNTGKSPQRILVVLQVGEVSSNFEAALFVFVTKGTLIFLSAGTRLETNSLASWPES